MLKVRDAPPHAVLYTKILCFERSPPIGAPAVEDMWCPLHVGRAAGRPGAPDVGDMWGLYLLFLSVGAGRWDTWGSRCRGYAGSVSVVLSVGVGRWKTWGSKCRGYVGSVSVVFICWGGPLADLGLQMSGTCGVCICCFYLLLGGEREGGEKRRNLTTPT